MLQGKFISLNRHVFREGLGNQMMPLCNRLKALAQRGPVIMSDTDRLKAGLHSGPNLRHTRDLERCGQGQQLEAGMPVNSMAIFASKVIDTDGLRLILSLVLTPLPLNI